MTPQFSMHATFRVHDRRESVTFTGVSPDKVIAKWGSYINALRLEDHTVSSVCAPIVDGST